MTLLFKARDELEEQIKERQAFNKQAQPDLTQLEDAGNDKRLLNRLLNESENRLHTLKNPSDELIEQLKTSQHNPMAEAAKLEVKIADLQKQLDSLDHGQRELQFQLRRLENKAAKFTTPLSEMQDMQAIYQQLETEHVKAGKLLKQITEQAKASI
ncbi:MAG: hypothetical protein R3F37_02435 [Candidatus Competibacteraceae bacterium]